MDKTLIKNICFLGCFFISGPSMAQKFSEVTCNEASKKILEGYGYQSGSVLKEGVQKKLFTLSEIEKSFLPVVQQVTRSGETGIDPQVKERGEVLNKLLNEAKVEADNKNEELRLIKRSASGRDGRKASAVKQVEESYKKASLKVAQVEKDIMLFESKNKVKMYCRQANCFLVKSDSLAILNDFIKQQKSLVSAAFSVQRLEFNDLPFAVVGENDFSPSYLQFATRTPEFTNAQRPTNIEIFSKSGEAIEDRSILKTLNSSAKLSEARDRVRDLSAKIRRLQEANPELRKNNDAYYSQLLKEHEAAVEEYTAIQFSLFKTKKDTDPRLAQEIKLIRNSSGQLISIDVAFDTGDYIQIPCDDKGKVDFSKFGAYSGPAHAVVRLFSDSVSSSGGRTNSNSTPAGGKK